MKVTLQYIKELITYLGLKPQDGDKDMFYKVYENHKDYIIKVNFDTERIEYGAKIKLGDHTTSNFESSENFVVLDCIDRLLNKGYPPESITLENKWPMGRKEKGKLDILIRDKEDKTYLMIECKTWGEEYEKEKKKMQRDGGQLFSYFQQDKAAQYLCLYASRLQKGQIEFINDIVQVDEQWKELNNQKEIFDHWNKNYKDNGIFEEWANAYNIEIKALTKGRLNDLKDEDSGRIFNQFAEILRHNIVSDKPNAFNKILNLFICKIIDEDRGENEEVSFQWFDDDTHEKLQIRLNDLYKNGMKQYLDIEVTDYTDLQLENKLYNINEPEIKKQIQEMFQHLRLQKNPEFAFKEVFNDKSFYDNAQVVKEVVELLQPFKFRYSHKQQFLGDFFELLLNTSIKQESGQYFTPVPIAKFIISCFPIREFIDSRIKTKDAEILPYVIDYAIGSGHFLTEWMDELQKIIGSINTDVSIRPTAKRKIEGWKQNEFEWAKDYVYGIEADYRLVKTAKVSSFLNGDGDAIIIRADGLDNFQNSTDYKGRLKEVSQYDTKDNAQFDILVANPPYSVSAFKNTLKNGNESFELFDRLTDQSSEIECLFMERTKQLLKPGGWAGVIMPNSILSNFGIYTDAREIILKYFNLKAIAEFGSNTFMATNTNTITLFLERKPNNEWKKIETSIRNFFDKPKEATVNGIEKAFGKYASTVFEELELEDYITLINKQPNDNLRKRELYLDYKSWFDSLPEIKQLQEKKAFKAKTQLEQQSELDKLFYEKLFNKEQDKMLYFFLVYPQQTVIIKVGEKQAEKDFIGYEFSSRRGHEGIKTYRDANGKAKTKLYDDEIHLNPERANTYVYKAFLNENIEISKTIAQNINIFDTLELIDFTKLNSGKSISLGVKKKIDFRTFWNTENLVSLTSIAVIQKGSSITQADTFDGKIPVVAGGKGEAYYHNDFNRDGNVITISASGAYSGFINYWEQPIFASDCNTVVSKDESLISTKLLFYFLKSIQDYFYSLQRGQAQPHVYASDIEKVMVPLPALEIQQRIIKETAVIEQKVKSYLHEINNLKNELKSEYLRLRSQANRFYRLDDSEIFEVFIGKRVLKSEIISHENGIPIYSANVFDPFGHTNYSIIDNFETPSLLWGIDGDWMINVMPSQKSFYPTDHCGVIRIKKSDFSINYLAYELLEIGKVKRFSRTFRASTERIKDLRVAMPSEKEQMYFEKLVEENYSKISAIETDLAKIEIMRKQILKKHLK